MKIQEVQEIKQREKFNIAQDAILIEEDENFLSQKRYLTK